MKRKKNPYVEAQKWLSRIGYAMLVVITIALVAALLVVIPISMLASGAPWWKASMPAIALVGGTAVCTLLAYAFVCIGEWWKAASNNWERKNR